ncbi:hypothetical protein AKJ09_03682 [Labilithrix luteola]|uniref:Addiction module toxin RelE n=1 Tax=Labilithrix luteola TaxID=1391654 RepID=A0A0K1PU00_9BACT|nr:hypothetical protein AKJ09_03682 [Labilithrix luteola]
MSDEFGAWFKGLDDAAQDDVARVVDMLEAKGVSLGFPQSSEIKGSKYALRELRIQSKGRPIRVIYAFDPVRDAYLIIGGDKTGNGRFYEEIVREAEKIWTEYLAER